jgi:hypothetical protein
LLERFKGPIGLEFRRQTVQFSCESNSIRSFCKSSDKVRLGYALDLRGIDIQPLPAVVHKLHPHDILVDGRPRSGSSESPDPDGEVPSQVFVHVIHSPIFCDIDRWLSICYHQARRSNVTGSPATSVATPPLMALCLGWRNGLFSGEGFGKMVKKSDKQSFIWLQAR